MKVKASIYTHDPVMAIELIAETDVEHAMLKNLFNFGAVLSQINTGEGVRPGAGFLLGIPRKPVTAAENK